MMLKLNSALRQVSGYDFYDLNSQVGQGQLDPKQEA